MSRFGPPLVCRAAELHRYGVVNRLFSGGLVLWWWVEGGGWDAFRMGGRGV
ncbi:Uncharacterised protein [Rhodococcus erythropolis]|nr:Uncharacterised protein [Rhodococcus erythropolis]